MNKKGMNKSEEKGYAWLLKKGYKKEEIIYQRKGIDFICADGKGYEVKKLYGHTIWFYGEQLERTKGNNNTVLVFDNSHEDPVATIQSMELREGKVISGIKITVVNREYKVMSVKENIAIEIQQRARKEGKNITDLLNELLNREGITTTLEEVHEAKKELTKGEIKTIIDKAIKGLENDISVLVRDAVKDAFAEMKGY